MHKYFAFSTAAVEIPRTPALLVFFSRLHKVEGFFRPHNTTENNSYGRTYPWPSVYDRSDLDRVFFFAFLG